MFPIRDSLQPRSTPYGTYALIFVNVAVFMFQLFLSSGELEALYQLYGLVPARLAYPQWAYVHGYPHGGWISLFTSMFLHGGWLHIIGNMWILWLFGDDVEDRLGTQRFLSLYIASGLTAGVTHLVLFSNSVLPTLGASGAVAGIMAAFLALFPKARIEFVIPIIFLPIVWSIPAILFIPLWFLSQVFSGALALACPGFGGIAFWAHIGGFASAFLWLGLLIKDSDCGFSNPEAVWGRGIQPKPRIIRGPGFVIIQPGTQYFNGPS